MIKKVLITILIIAVLIVGGVFILKSSQDDTKYTSEAQLGNSAGNLYNGGLFCEYDDEIYFSNLNDDGALYRMDPNLTNFKRISDDKVSYINANEHYIVYSRLNNKKQQLTNSLLTFNYVGIYRIDKDGSDSLMLDDSAVGLVTLYGNDIYFQHYSNEDAYSLYRVKVNGEETQQLDTNPIEPAMITNNYLYYSDTKTLSFDSLDLESLAIDTVISDTCYMPIITDQYIYYISISKNYSLVRCDINGLNPIILVNERCCTYNITPNEQYLYYQVDNNSNNRICRLNLDTLESTTIQQGNYSNINVTNEYVFFQGFDSDVMYYMKPSSNEEPKIFNPEVKK